MPNSDSPLEKHNKGRGEYGFVLQMPRLRPKKTKKSVKGEKLSMPNSDSPPEKHNKGRGEYGFRLQMPRFRPKKTKTSVKGHNDPPLSNFDVVKENDNSAIDQIKKSLKQKRKKQHGFKFPKFGFPSFVPPSANHSDVLENGRVQGNILKKEDKKRTKEEEGLVSRCQSSAERRLTNFIRKEY
ncbi:uncharacterized protein LOC130648901 isoform X2 [Hydractinia symbiolongicarpus]|nr:uncharacterized protein LOC130648901 isoform X2 [Hydractinia symbiolongicarpus]